MLNDAASRQGEFLDLDPDISLAVSVGPKTYQKYYDFMDDKMLRRTTIYSNVCNTRVPFGHKIILLCSGDWEGVYTYQLSPLWETIEKQSIFHTRTQSSH
ncbi:hypothetical protein V1517DRAFT_314525 [Lipomyces orientalis]|uniref:Uncharacterized protein n=1 Tax=Lipomyces orientalis TaxID=1233043 RepID=A0ACC3TWD2_9ASCO